MKHKFLTLVLMLVAMITGSASAWADGNLPEFTTDMDHPVYYRIKNLYTDQYVIYSGAADYMKVTTNAQAASRFYFVQNGADVAVPGLTDVTAPCVKIYADGSGDKYLRSANSWDNSNTRHWFLMEKTNEGFEGFVMCYTETTDALKVGSTDIQLVYYGNKAAGYNYKGSVFAVEKCVEGEFGADPAPNSLLPQLSTKDAPKYYRIKNAVWGKYMVYTGNETNIALTDNADDASLFYAVGDGADATTPQVRLYASNSGDCYLHSVTDGSTRWNNNSTRQWYMKQAKINELSGFMMVWDNAARYDAICQQDKKGEKGAVYFGQDGQFYPQSLWIAEEVSATPEQLLKEAEDNLTAVMEQAKGYTIGTAVGQFSVPYAGALPILTSNESAPVLYRIANTRRTGQGKANYITASGTLSANAADAAQVYFVGAETDGLQTVKMYDAATGKALEAAGDSKPAAGLASNFTWSEAGANLYIKARKSLQGGAYDGVVIAFNNPGHDDLGGDAAGGDTWYVGSSDPVVWAYSGQYDGSIFTFELVDPSQGAKADDILSPLMAEAKALLAGSHSQSEVEQMTTKIEQAIASLAINMPQAGDFFYLKSATYENSYVSCNGEKFPMLSAPDASSIFYFDGANLINYTTGLTVAKTYHDYGKLDAVMLENADAVKFVNKGNCMRIQTNLSSDVHELLLKAAGNDMDSWTKNINSSDANLTVEAVASLPVSISAAGYATLYAPVSLTVPAGVKAYTLTENGETLTATEVSTIPANTGVVLEAAAGTYQFAITTGGEGTSCLTGTIATKTASPAYTLAVEDEVAGFYKYTGETLGGFKAYYEKAADVKGFAISFGETAIQAIQNQKTDAAIYDLQGRKVAGAQKGIFIMGGKKIVK